MKKIISISLAFIVFTACAWAAEADGTNSPDTNSFTLARIPDATHKPVCVTNTVIIAGEPVTYTAETGMLPILKADGTSRASIFYVAYTRVGLTNPAAR